MNGDEDLVIRRKRVTRDGAPFVLAEIGVNHDGDVKVGRELVEAAAAAGADGVKFQLFTAELLLAAEAGLVDYQKANGAKSAREMLRRLELSVAQIAGLVKLAHKRGMAAVVTPFSVELVEGVVKCGADAVKLASPDLVNRPLVEAAARTRLPLVLSTGAAEMEEVERTREWVEEARSQKLETRRGEGSGARRHGPAGVVWLHCVSAYPAGDEWANLGGITVMREAFPQALVGYSDHTLAVVTGGLAVMCGACFLEKHLTLGKGRTGPDHAASLEPGEMKVYIEFARRAWRMRGRVGRWEKGVLDVERGVREQTRQSVVAARDLKAGRVLAEGDLTVKRPGTGIPAAGMRELYGRKVVRAVKRGAMLRLGDLGDPQD